MMLVSSHVAYFSRRAHTVLTLLVFIAFMVYVAVFEDPGAHDNAYNFKRFVTFIHP